MPKRPFHGSDDTRPTAGQNQRTVGAPDSSPRTDFEGVYDNRAGATVEENRGHIRAPKGRGGDHMRSVY